MSDAICTECRCSASATLPTASCPTGHRPARRGLLLRHAEKHPPAGVRPAQTTSLRDLIDEETDFQQDLPDLTEADYKRLADLRVEKMRVNGRLRELEPEAISVKVTGEDLAQVLELWTGIPASKIRETEL